MNKEKLIEKMKDAITANIIVHGKWDAYEFGKAAEACAEAALTLMSREWVTSKTSHPPANRLVEIVLQDGYRVFATLKEDGYYHASKKRKYPYTAVRCWTFALPTPPKQ